MSFLAPWALALAALLAVPLLLHLRRRDPTRRVAFPAIRYLSRAREATARTLRASDLLLLAVRMGLLLCLTAAAAGPLVGRGGPADHRPTDLALVVDNTASAGRLAGERTLLELFLERAGDALAEAGPADRVWVFPAAGDPVAAGVPAARAAAALRRVTPTDGGASLAAAVAEASAALPAEDERAREVLLLSDLQATALAGDALPSGPAAVAPPLIVYRPPPTETANGAVTALALESGSRWPAGLPQGLTVEARRFGDAASGRPDAADGEASLRLEIDGRTVGGVSLAWGGTAAFRVDDLPPGPHRGRVEIEPYGLRADDARHFAFRVDRPPAVSHAGPARGFLAVALETLRAAGRLGTGPDRVRIVEGVARPSGRGRPGAVAAVFIPPEDPVDLAAFNQLLEREGVPWRLRPDSLIGDLELAGGGGAPGLAGARVSRRYLTDGPALDPATDEAILETSDGRPWLLGHRVGGRRHLLLVSPLVPEATGIPASPAMIPFVEALLLQWSRAAEGDAPAGAAGVAIVLPGGADSVRAPDGSVISVEGGAPFVPARAGIYEVMGPTPGPLFLAANVPVGESDLRAADPARLQELFPGREVDMAGPDPAEWRRALFRARRGAAATGWLLLAVLALAAAETALATPGREAPSPDGRGEPTTFVGS